MLPFSIRTFRSFTHAPSTPLSVLVARATAWLIASSNPVSEVALNSVTRATLIASASLGSSLLLTSCLIYGPRKQTTNTGAGTPRRIPRLILYSSSNKSRSTVGGVGCSVAKLRTAHLYASPQHVVSADGDGHKIRYALSGSMKALKEGGCAYDGAGAQDKAQ